MPNYRIEEVFNLGLGINVARNGSIAGLVLIGAVAGSAPEDASGAMNTSRDLGMDPATGAFRQGEYDMAIRIQQAQTVILQRSADPGVDWVDAEGNTYDAVGDFSSKYSAQNTSTSSGRTRTRILDHMAKADFVCPFTGSLSDTPASRGV